MAETRTRAALSLGSGGARGYAHIGAIQVLVERGFDIVAITGASMGALVGALHATEQLGAYTEWVMGLSQFDVLRLMDVSLSRPGVIRADKMFARVQELLGDTRIEDLPLHYTAVATDLVARRAVWFQEGPIGTAVRASIAIPGVFTPLMLNGRVLVDGGLMDPVPVAPSAAARADVTIAVDLGGERDRAERETAEEGPVEEWAERFRRAASNLLDRDVVRSVLARFDSNERSREPTERDEPEPFPAGLGRFDVMNQSLEAMQSLLTRYRLAGNPPDVHVVIPKDACRTLDFHRAAEMIALGRDRTIEALARATLDADS